MTHDAQVEPYSDCHPLGSAATFFIYTEQCTHFLRCTRSTQAAQKQLSFYKRELCPNSYDAQEAHRPHKGN